MLYIFPAENSVSDWAASLQRHVHVVPTSTAIKQRQMADDIDMAAILAGATSFDQQRTRRKPGNASSTGPPPLKVPKLAVAEHASRTAALATPLAADNKGFQLLAKSGWTPGTGLGKSMQGAPDPVPVVARVGRAGVGAPLAAALPPAVADAARAAAHADRAAAALAHAAAEFTARTVAQHAARRELGDLWRAQRILHDLDGSGSGPESTADAEEDAGEDPHDVTPKLHAALMLLRSVHHYCFYCATCFPSAAALAAECPGLCRAEHADADVAAAATTLPAQLLPALPHLTAGIALQPQLFMHGWNRPRPMPVFPDNVLEDNTHRPPSCGVVATEPWTVAPQPHGWVAGRAHVRACAYRDRATAEPCRVQTRLLPYCAAHTHAVLSLCVGPSALPDAGLGLFACAPNQPLPRHIGTTHYHPAHDVGPPAMVAVSAAAKAAPSPVAVFQTGDLIHYMEGEVLSWANYEARYGAQGVGDKWFTPYAARLPNGSVIDALIVRGIMSTANDPAGLVAAPGPPDVNAPAAASIRAATVNCKPSHPDRRPTRMPLFATRPLQHGDEVLVSYGPAWWAAFPSPTAWRLAEAQVAEASGQADDDMRPDQR